ncbi:MAG TPA: isoprenylcysteine carboxylmethyltransferase family protein [Stellaceae bacterium]|nr:isoprenylcysteine carboxylmethyltransferase family protein [Stellaceae bacterium]
MARFLGLLYGAAAYCLFVGTLLYAVGFVGNLWVPKSIDSGVPGPLVESVIVDLLLLGLFAVQHSVMARPGFKRWWTRIVPPVIERSTYVLLASLALLLLFWQWRPLPDLVWSVEDPVAAAVLAAMPWFGWAMLFFSTCLISHFELFGLSQVVARFFGRELPSPSFDTPSLYRYVRHPIYLSFLLALWPTPAMSLGHLLFAAGATGYILVGIQLEERDLVVLFGDRYRRYRRQVGMLLPLPGRRHANRRNAPGAAE